MEKKSKKNSKYHKISTKTYNTETNDIKFNSTNAEFSPKKFLNHHKKHYNAGSESNLNNYINFNKKLDNNIKTEKKSSRNAALFKRRSVKFTHHSHKRKISSNLKSDKELENIGKINSSTKCFTPVLGLRSFHFHDHHYKKKNIINENFNCQIKQKKIKINLVSLKFKIANDYDEAHSNIFLNEKDECLKEIKLTDKIKKNEENDFELSPISPTTQEKKLGKHKLSMEFKPFYCLNNSSDSGEYLSQLLKEVQ